MDGNVTMAKLALKFVNSFRDRHGRLRHYFRCKGGKAIPLPGLPGSEEFMAAYQAALTSLETEQVEIGASRTLPGTIDALVVAYYRSAEWNNLSRSTKKNRKTTIEQFRERHGTYPVATLKTDHILKMMAAIASPSVRRNWLKAIRHLLQSAIPTMRKDDPTSGIATVKLPKGKPHHTWSDVEIGQYRAFWPLGTQQRLVLEFALETASRRCEVVKLGPQHIKNGRIRIERAKGSRNVEILVTPELQAACDAMPRNHLTYVVNAWGKPRSIEGLGVVFAEWATQAGLPARCRLHGLKKACLTQIVDNGGTSHEVMGVSGHKSLSQVELYTREANQKRLGDSGMAKRLRGKESPGHDVQGKGQSENATVTNLATPLAQTRK
jgi:integrase